MILLFLTRSSKEFEDDDDDDDEKLYLKHGKNISMTIGNKGDIYLK